MANSVRRCAIYTRKSSEEGLEQEYNSLDAQRDAGEAFIRSQKHEGWKALKENYDDGGISGGHLERPGLQRLLADIKAGKIDVVVVYKVDRLSRSLADFAQLMQLFDKQNVSFVSVTQQFNTSSSMGRLTLNVLLSFAQFEREVTGERIRDKIALSKQKGMWMGGVPPLGYDIFERKLVINTTEAEVVKTCFHTYQDKSGLIETVIELNRLSLKTKAFTSVKGRVQEGKPWVAKQLHRILTNPVYRGKIQHKEKLHAGEHPAIIDETLWSRVQKKLREHQPEYRKTGGHLNEIAIGKSRLIHPLKGFVYGIDGQALTPTYTNKSQKRADGGKVRKRYRYYISQQAIRQGYKSSILKTINAHLLEESVRQILIQSMPGFGCIVSSEGLSMDQIQHRLAMHANALSRSASALDFTRWIEAMSPKIVVGPQSIQIHISHPRLNQLVETFPEYSENETPETIVRPTIPTVVHRSDYETTLTAKIEFKRQRGRVEIIDGCTGNSISPSRSEPNATLIQTIVQAEFWRAELQKQPSKPLNEITRKFNIEPAYVRRLLNAAYLAPTIKESIFQGTQPAKLQVQDLIQQRSADWQLQIRELGFERIDFTACH
ncbi:MAG: recombinase family protein [Verrucomicrobiota bacterium]